MLRIRLLPLTALTAWFLTSAAGCGSSSSNDEAGVGGTGGSVATTGGAAQSGGAKTTTGGSTASGGAATGGERATGGAQATGGAVGTGGDNGIAGSNDTGGGAAGAPTTGGVAATGGAVSKGGADGAAGKGGSGGSPTPPGCPATPPAAGDPCNNPPSCFYDACPGGKRTLATCNDLKWTVEEGTSCEVDCPLQTSMPACPAGTYCMVTQGGFVFAECTPHTCGTGPVTAECTALCPMTFSLEGGVTVTCNNCPQGGCP